MRMKFARTTALVIYALTALLNTGCVTTQIHKFRMTASEAPEVHGANTNQKQNSSVWRFTGKVNYNYEEKVNISEDIYETADLDRLFEKEIKFKDAAYEMGGLDFSGKIDYLYKGKSFVVGGGLGYKDGLFSHLTMGANFTHFEFGTFIGTYSQYSDLEYWGETGEDCGDDDGECKTIGDHTSRFNASFFAGLYAGFYFDKLFFNLSVSSYGPNSEIEGIHLDTPGIATGYLTAGYRLNRWLEFSVGGVFTYIGTSDWHDNVGVTGGISLYL